MITYNRYLKIEHFREGKIISDEGSEWVVEEVCGLEEKEGENTSLYRDLRERSINKGDVVLVEPDSVVKISTNEGELKFVKEDYVIAKKVGCEVQPS